MSGNESAAEELVELGIEIVNPGGRPDELEQAAKEWRALKTEVEGMLRQLNKQVEGVVGNSWRGPAAEAFEKHWHEFKSAVESATEQFDDAAKGLDDAADNIKKVNDEVHDIYKEIGISVAVSVGMSFLTVGVSAAAGTARVTMLVNRAMDAIGRLGQLLRAVATAFRTLHNSGRMGKLAAQGLANWASGTAGGMVTSKLSGKGWEVTTNLAGGLGGATAGTAAGSAAKALGRGDFISGVAGGAAGGVAGDALDSTPLFSGKEFDARQTAVTAVTGGAAGGLSGSAGGIHKGMDEFARDMDGDFAYRGPRSETQDFGSDVAFGAGVPVAGGVSANAGKDGFEDVDQKVDQARDGAKDGAQGSTATDRIRRDFG